jgi:exonuclease III
MNLENLNLLGWNVRVLGDPTKCLVVKEVVKDPNAIIFYFQETKLSNITLNKFYTFAPPYFHHFFAGIQSDPGVKP